METKGFIKQRCWAHNRQQALFVYLVLNRKHVVTPEELQQQFWPYLPAEKVEEEVTAVSRTLSHILDLPNPILKLRQGVQLRATIPLWVDVEEIEYLLSQATETPQSVQRRQLLQQAVALYQNDFLYDLPLHLKWIISWRAHFQQRYLTALQTLSVLHEQAGDPAAAQKIYADALKIQPLTTEHGRSFLHLIQNNSAPSQTLHQCQRLITLLQSELEVLLEKYTQPFATSDSPEDQTQEIGKG